MELHNRNGKTPRSGALGPSSKSSALGTSRGHAASEASAASGNAQDRERKEPQGGSVKPRPYENTINALCHHGYTREQAIELIVEKQRIAKAKAASDMSGTGDYGASETSSDNTADENSNDEEESQTELERKKDAAVAPLHERGYPGVQVASPSSKGVTPGLQTQTSHQRIFQETKYGTVIYTIADSNTGQTSRVETGQSRQLTSSSLQAERFQVHKRLRDTKGRHSSSPRYKVSKTPRIDFQVGKVIELMWAEPMDGATTITHFHAYSDRTWMRRFVVVHNTQNNCAALPISTYNGLGVTLSGLRKSQHAIIYTGTTVPPLLSGEEFSHLPDGSIDTLRRSVRVEGTHPANRLDPKSRLNFGKVYQIDHACEIYVFGTVASDSGYNLVYQYRDVQNSEPNAQTSTARSASHQRNDSAQPGSTVNRQTKISPGPESANIQQPLSAAGSDVGVAALTQRMNALNVRAERFGANLSRLTPGQRQRLAGGTLDQQHAYLLRILQTENHQRYEELRPWVEAQAQHDPDEASGEEEESDEEEEDE